MFVCHCIVVPHGTLLTQNTAVRSSPVHVCLNQIWMEAGLDMRLKPYRCLATGVNDDGEGVGMIEVVLNSDTTSGIQLVSDISLLG